MKSKNNLVPLPSYKPTALAFFAFLLSATTSLTSSSGFFSCADAT
jgi:hypothetical protein